MNWDEITFDWNRARVFLISASEGSMSAAAKALKTTQPTVSRQVAALEQELGVDLFERGAKGLVLTPSGSKLLQLAHSMGEVAREFSLAATLQADSLEGEVSITANELMAMHTLPSLITKLSIEHPALKIKLIASNKVSDILSREADIAIRSFRPTQQGLIARKLREDQYRLYASREYVASVKDWNDTANLRFVGFAQTDKLISFCQEQGLEITTNNFNVTCDEHPAHWELVRQGAGIGFAYEELANDDPTVVQVLPQLQFPKTERWLVSHRELRTTKRIRLVFDYLANALSKA